jgi:hypothetical protein
MLPALKSVLLAHAPQLDVFERTDYPWRQRGAGQRLYQHFGLRRSASGKADAW